MQPVPSTDGLRETDEGSSHVLREAHREARSQISPGTGTSGACRASASRATIAAAATCAAIARGRPATNAPSRGRNASGTGRSLSGHRPLTPMAISSHRRRPQPPLRHDRRRQLCPGPWRRRLAASHSSCCKAGRTSRLSCRSHAAKDKVAMAMVLSRLLIPVKKLAIRAIKAVAAGAWACSPDNRKSAVVTRPGRSSRLLAMVRSPASAAIVCSCEASNTTHSLRSSVLARSARGASRLAT